jgi:flagellar basal-body rod modification protein FlgD
MADDISSLLSPSGTTAGANGSQSREQLESLNSLASNFDNFLTILTTQLQNQDPLSPLDTHEFTNQLVMFADVEQSVRQSGQLEDLIRVNSQNQATAAVGFMGQEIRADHNEVNFTGEPVTMSYTLPEQADQAAMEVYNGAGELVRLITGISKEFGQHELTWDGTDQFGNPLPTGGYSFQVGAVNADDQPIEATYETEGTVTGVEFNGGETTLMMGNVRIPLERVLRVEDPAA